jgi:uncharacterized membrane protein (UPF0127 family)
MPLPARVLALLLCGACAPAVRFERDDGSLVREFADVEVATTAEDRRVGLSEHAPLGVAQALVLEFPGVGEVCVTNASVSFPIVAHFVADDGRVVAQEALAAREARAPCHLGVRRVIETDEAGAPGATVAR